MSKVSRALRIMGLLLLASTAAAAQRSGPGPQVGAAREREVAAASAQTAWRSAQASARGSRSAAVSSSRHAQRRDSSGRVWSPIDLAVHITRAADGSAWTTESYGSWSYSYSSDGTRCVSKRAAERVFISCN